MIWLIAGYLWMTLHQPYIVWTWMGTFRIEKIYAIIMLTAWATAAEKSFIENKVNLAVGLMVIAMTVSAVMSPYLSVIDNQAYYDWMKAAVIYLLMMTLVKSEKDLKILLATLIISQFLYMAHSYREFLGGRGSWQQGVWKIVGADFADANTLGMRANYLLPFLVPFMTLIKKKWQYLFVIAYFLLMMRIIQLTGSRTAFMMSITVISAGAVLSRHRWKIIPFLLIGAAAAWVFMDEQHKNRYRTIWSSEAAEEMGAQSFSEGRLTGFWGGLQVFMTSPVYGVGPECYMYTPTAIMNEDGGAVRNGRQAGHLTHFLYGEIPAEEGLLGILGWSLMLVCVFLNHLQIRGIYNDLKRRKRENEGKFVMMLSGAVMFSFFLLLLGGFAGHNALNYHWLWYPAFQGVGLYVLQQKMLAIKKAESLSAIHTGTI